MKTKVTLWRCSMVDHSLFTALKVIEKFLRGRQALVTSCRPCRVTIATRSPVRIFPAELSHLGGLFQQFFHLYIL